MENKLKVSIIIPCYNQGHFLSDCLDSVQNQTYTNWECIIVDDGSTDSTAEIAKKRASEDERIIYFHKTNGGLSSARNFGLSKATGHLIQFLDSDDILNECKLEESVFFIENEGYDVVVTNFSMLENNKIKPPFCDISKREFTYKNLLLKWDIDFNFPPHSLLITSKILENLKFEEEFKAKEDWIMWLEVFKRTSKIKFIDKHLVLYRMHKDNMTKNKIHMDDYTAKAHKYVLRKEELYFDEFFDRIVNEKISKLEKHINKIINRPWYKKIFYAIIGKK